MKVSIKELRALVKESLQERQWNKNSDPPRKYKSDPSGSKEQEERNKRKRDQREYIKKHGKCPKGEELHHVNGIESDEVRCEPIKKNRGRREKSRLATDEAAIKIEESDLKNIIKEETKNVLQEFLGPLIAKAALSTGGALASYAAEKGGEAAIDAVLGGDDDDQADETEKKFGNIKVKSYEDLANALNALFKKAATGGLSGDYKMVASALEQAPQLMQHLKK